MSDWDKLQHSIQKNYDSLYEQYEQYKEPVNRKSSSITFDELFNADCEMDILEREGEYDLNFNMVQGEPDPNGSNVSADSVLPNENGDNYTTNGIDNIHDDDEACEDMKDELKVIYKKFMFCSLIVIIICTITLTAAIGKNFYNWNGILFNVFVIIVAMYGLLIHFYFKDCAEGSYSFTKKRKLKHLLIYFSITFGSVFILFIIALVYVVLIPIRVSRNDGYSDAFLTACIISGVFGVILWTILVSFYIDLCARACLKRGRIDFTIIELDSIFYNRLYRFVILFRIKFRATRRFLTTMTGIHCIGGRLKFDKLVVGKLHEEQRALAILENDEYNCCECKTCQVNIEDKVLNFTDFCSKCACCFCIALGAIFEKINPCIVISVIVFCIIFAPLAMYLLIILLLGSPLIVAGSFKNYYAIPCILAIPMLYVIWYAPWGICPNNYFNTERFPKQWNWTSQCMLWDFASLILLYFLAEMSDSN